MHGMLFDTLAGIRQIKVMFLKSRNKSGLITPAGIYKAFKKLMAAAAPLFTLNDPAGQNGFGIGHARGRPVVHSSTRTSAHARPIISVCVIGEYAVRTHCTFAWR